MTSDSTPPLDLVGNVDLSRHDLIDGWVFERGRPDGTLDLTIFMDGVKVATVPTGRNRPDVEAAFPNAGTSGFEFAIPPYLCDGKLHLITITLAGSMTVLPGCPFVYELGYPTSTLCQLFSLNSERPVLSDISELAAGIDTFNSASQVWLDRRLSTHPVERVGKGGSGYRPSVPYIVSFRERFANARHGTVYNRQGEVWQGCSYLRDSSHITEDRARIQHTRRNLACWTDVVIFSTSMRDNYFHWHLDCLAGLYFVTRHVDLSDRLVLGPPLNAWQRDSIKLLGVDRYVEVDGLLYADNIITSGYTDGRGIFPDHQVREMFRRLRFASHSGTASVSERLFISRADAKHRVLENEDELWRALDVRGFQRIVPTELSCMEQLMAFSGARVVVASHGAAMVNTGYAEPNLLVFEIRQASYANPCFEHLSLLSGHQHHVHTIEKGPYRVDVGAFLNQLDQTVPEFTSPPKPGLPD